MVDLVSKGSSGWLFLTGGSNRVLDIYKSNNIPKNWSENWRSLLSDRAKKLSDRGIEYYHVSAPEKLAIYNGFAPVELGVDWKCSPTLKLAALMQGSDVNYINPVMYLREQSEKYKVYHKTDSHWTFTGAYCAYQLLMSKMQLSHNVSVLTHRNKLVECVLDLGGKFPEKPKELISFYSLSESARRVWVNDLVKYKESKGLDNSIGLHVGCSVEFENDSPLHDLRVLIFGDSFSEYRPHLLTGILAETFRSVRFVWGMNLDFDIVDEFKPNILISESAERFMPFSTPNDSFSYEKFVAEKISKDFS